MAIIYTYPTKATPVDADLILISDSESNPANQTKQITVASIKGLTSGVTSIIPGTNVTITSTGASGTGDVTINSSGGSGGTPGVPVNSVQFNNAGAFGGDANLTFTGSGSNPDTLTLTDTLDIKGDGTNPGTLNLYCEDTTTPHAVSILGPVHTGATPYSIRLPKEIATQSVYSSGGRILESDASGALQWIVTPTGGSTLPIEEEGSQITAAAAKINFTGTGATASASGNDVTVNIPAISVENSGAALISGITTLDFGTSLTPTSAGPGTNKVTIDASSGGISFSGSTANGIATYSSASIANVSSNLTIDNTSKKLNIGSTYSIQDDTGVFKIGSLSSTQAQESIEFHINGAQKVKVDSDGRLVASVGSAASPNLKLGTGSDGIYGTTNAVQIVTNGASKISVSDGQTANIQMNDLVEFGYGLKFGSSGSTLSTYTEATWTGGPTLTFSVGSTATLSASTGSYRVIGDMVFAQFQFTFDSGGYGTVDMSLPLSGVAGTGSINFAKMNSNVGNSTVSTPVTGDILTSAASIRLQSFNYDQDSSSHVSGQLFELVATSGQPVFQNGDVVSGTIIYRKS
jgi:hypothetical protein